MPTVFTHAVVGLGLGWIFATGRPMPLAFWGLSAALSALPDLDVITLALGLPYGSRFGHRGFSHSLCCALLVSLPVALLTYRPFGVAWWLLWGYFFVVMASHGVLDAFTNGGYGIAFFSPFDPTRYFFPWRPVEVAPIGVTAFFGPWGLRVLGSEMLWIWLPLGVVVAAVKVWRQAA
ncbi:MAG TPA: metal-dependent hydrolase [Gemmataceae bacterium]|nr:metal-dependent hydrolase [Gemmataceae bacterium]